MKRIAKKTIKVKQKLRQKRSIAAIKGWETRRKNAHKAGKVRKIRVPTGRKTVGKGTTRDRGHERAHSPRKRVPVSGGKSRSSRERYQFAAKKKASKSPNRTARKRVRKPQKTSKKEQRLQTELRRVKAQLKAVTKAHKKKPKKLDTRAAKRALREKLDIPKRKEVFEIAKRQKRQEIISGMPLTDVLRMLTVEERAQLESMTVVDVFKDMSPYERQQSIKKYIQETMDRACRLFGDVRITAYEIAEELIDFDIDFSEVYDIWDYDRGRIFGEAA